MNNELVLVKLVYTDAGAVPAQCRCHVPLRLMRVGPRCTGAVEGRRSGAVDLMIGRVAEVTAESRIGHTLLHCAGQGMQR